MYFNICGTDDPSAPLGTMAKPGPDVQLVGQNLVAAGTNVSARFSSLYLGKC